MIRPSTPADREFLYRVYASTRAEELRPVPWSDEQKEAFLRQQFQAQDTHYRREFPDASFDVLVENGQDVGRLYVDRRPNELHVLDIALLPPFQKQGLGGRLMRELLAQGLPVSIYVERTNPARRLYDRLGFVMVEPGPVYDLMFAYPKTAS